VGTSFTESWTPLLVLLGLLAVLRDAEKSSWRLVVAAGLALGAAAGFTLVNGVYAIALLLTLCTTFRRPGFLRRIASYCAGAAAAALLVGGPWAFAVARQFGNPFFPFFNRIFRSPYFAPFNLLDPRWKARNRGRRSIIRCTGPPAPLPFPRKPTFAISASRYSSSCCCRC